MDSLACIYTWLTWEEQSEVPSIELSSVPGLLILILILTPLMDLNPAIAAEVLRRGSYSQSVVKLQDDLKKAYCFPADLPSTGYYGRTTEKAVKELQRTQGLRIDGIVGTQTRSALDAYQACFLKYRRQGEEVKKLQQQLNNWGFPVGEVDGVFGKKTLAAVIRFQNYHSLKPDGIVGPKMTKVLWTPRTQISQESQETLQANIPNNTEDNTQEFPQANIPNNTEENTQETFSFKPLGDTGYIRWFPEATPDNWIYDEVEYQTEESDNQGQIGMPKSYPSLNIDCKDNEIEQYSKKLKSGNIFSIEFYQMVACGTEAVPTLIDFIKDKNATKMNRFTAIWALKDIYPVEDEAISVLIEVLQDKNQDPLIRGAAAESLLIISPKRNPETVIPALENVKEDKTIVYTERVSGFDMTVGDLAKRALESIEKKQDSEDSNNKVTFEASDIDRESIELVDPRCPIRYGITKYSTSSGEAFYRFKPDKKQENKGQCEVAGGGFPPETGGTTLTNAACDAAKCRPTPPPPPPQDKQKN